MLENMLDVVLFDGEESCSRRDRFTYGVFIFVGGEKVNIFSVGQQA
jgi:hypothetical protein